MSHSHTWGGNTQHGSVTPFPQVHQLCPSEEALSSCRAAWMPLQSCTGRTTADGYMANYTAMIFHHSTVWMCLKGLKAKWLLWWENQSITHFSKIMNKWQKCIRNILIFSCWSLDSCTALSFYSTCLQPLTRAQIEQREARTVTRITQKKFSSLKNLV